MEKEIQNELQNIVGSIEENGNQPMNPRNMLASAVMNTLWKYAAGKLFKIKHTVRRGSVS